MGWLQGGGLGVKQTGKDRQRRGRVDLLSRQDGRCKINLGSGELEGGVQWE